MWTTRVEISVVSQEIGSALFELYIIKHEILARFLVLEVYIFFEFGGEQSFVDIGINLILYVVRAIELIYQGWASLYQVILVVQLI